MKQFDYDTIPIADLPYGGLEAGLSDEERAIADMIRGFATDVMRPLGQKLDRMTADEVAAEGSPVLGFLEQMKALGMGIETLVTMPAGQMVRMFPLVQSILGWGDAGLAILAGASGFPATVAQLSGNAELIERFGSCRGCWIGTQPDRGSDTTDLDGREKFPGRRHGKANLVARVTRDEVILHGQTSAWVTGAPIAECGLAYIPADYGNGLYADDGTMRGAVVFVPFDEPGVSRGKPLEKLGQRPLPQGEVFFDEVRLPRRYLMSDDSAYRGKFFSAFTLANMEMACVFAGVARAALDHALAYVHEREQGGALLIEHQSVRARIFRIWQSSEAAFAIAQRCANYNFLGNPHVLASITAKVTATQHAVQAADEALQLFGGYGLSREYPMEKLLRDARAATIEDGENHMLGLVAAGHLSQWFQSSGLRGA
ncbi:MAG: acyl-CoA/acyl-ACP dehydrogenase [Deltaproteobacteria bacterium]|nr:acyl-CoA/acyl-ACP dehydrogenase [Deltaproteobacteria bacterium]